MKILGLYTHQNTVHVYLKDKLHETTIFETLSEGLPVLLSNILQFGSLDCIAVQRGPDTFTSLRVTLALVQGFCTGLGIKVYACTHFDLIQKAHDISSGLIVIQNKSSLLPAVEIIDGVMQEPIQVSPEESDKRGFKPFAEVNLGKVLAEMAADQSWINPADLTPYYCFLPTYRKSFP